MVCETMCVLYEQVVERKQCDASAATGQQGVCELAHSSSFPQNKSFRRKLTKKECFFFPKHLLFSGIDFFPVLCLKDYV